MSFPIVKNCMEPTILQKESDYLFMPVWGANIINMLLASQPH